MYLKRPSYKCINKGSALQDRVQDYRNKWGQHLERMEEIRLPKAVRNYCPKGQTWTDQWRNGLCSSLELEQARSLSSEDDDGR
jgi:hypothetical protein